MELAHSEVYMWGVEATLGTWVSHCTSLKMCVKRTERLIGTGGRRLAGVCVRARLGKGHDLNLLGRLWPARRKGWVPQARDEHPCGSWQGKVYSGQSG